jgi:hypothetical protein
MTVTRGSSTDCAPGVLHRHNSTGVGTGNGVALRAPVVDLSHHHERLPVAQDSTKARVFGQTPFALPAKLACQAR